jgi:hypothetical protein
MPGVGAVQIGGVGVWLHPFEPDELALKRCALRCGRRGPAGHWLAKSIIGHRAHPFAPIMKAQCVDGNGRD